MNLANPTNPNLNLDSTDYADSWLGNTPTVILPLTAHAVINILNLNYINSIIFNSLTTKLSNDMHYN